MLGSTWYSAKRGFYLSAAVVIVLCLTSSYFVWHREQGVWSTISRLGPSTAALACPSITASPEPTITISPPVLGPPAEYLYQNQDQHDCERFYGIPYLEYIATHQTPYCQPASQGALQCFSAPRYQHREQNDWQNDTLCLAQGVRYGRLDNESPSAKQVGAKFSMQCTLRNLTQDSLASPARAKELYGFPELENMQEYWFGTGIGPTLKDWYFAESPGGTECTSASANHEWILIVKRENNDNIWHKMNEIWQAKHTIDALQMSINPTTGQPWLTPEQAKTITVVFDDDRQEPFDHLWTIASGNKPVRMSGLSPGTCFGNVIIPLAGSSSPFWSALLEDAYHESCRNPVLLEAWVRRVFQFLNINVRPSTDVHRQPTITIVDRAKNRKFINLDQWAATLRTRYPKSNITVADFATLSLEEQLNLVQQTDVFVGHHGAAMTHTLFLNPEAAVVEIYPPVFPSRGFRSLARMRGLSHFGANCMWPEEWNQTVNGVPLPEDWQAPKDPVRWQSAEWTYMTDGEFLGIVDAAVRNQRNKRYQPHECAPDC